MGLDHLLATLYHHYPETDRSCGHALLPVPKTGWVNEALVTFPPRPSLANLGPFSSAHPMRLGSARRDPSSGVSSCPSMSQLVSGSKSQAERAPCLRSGRDGHDDHEEEFTWV